MILDLIAVAVGLTILWRTKTMNDKLQASVDQLVAETQESQGKLASIRTYLTGIPALVAAAVAQALSNANVDDETAAGEIDQARQTISDSVDQTLSAIDANPAPGDTGSVATGGSDTGAGGSDTAGAGAATGTQAAATGTQAAAGGGSDDQSGGTTNSGATDVSGADGAGGSDSSTGADQGGGGTDQSGAGGTDAGQPTGTAT